MPAARTGCPRRADPSMRLPIHSGRFAACFVGAGAARTAAALAAEPRFAARLRQWAEAHYRLAPGPLVFAAPEDVGMALLGEEALEALAMPCGAAIWSAAIAREIRGDMVAAMAEQLGAAAMAAARRHRDLACERELPGDLAALAPALLADGRSCIASWIAAQPAATRAWLLMRWPSDAAAPEEGDFSVAAHGALVLRRVAAEAGTA